MKSGRDLSFSVSHPDRRFLDTPHIPNKQVGSSALDLSVKPKSCFNEWHNVTVQEVDAFLVKKKIKSKSWNVGWVLFLANVHNRIWKYDAQK